jgi:hypothetical protein
LRNYREQVPLHRTAISPTEGTSIDWRIGVARSVFRRSTGGPVAHRVLIKQQPGFEAADFALYRWLGHVVEVVEERHVAPGAASVNGILDASRL